MCVCAEAPPGTQLWIEGGAVVLGYVKYFDILVGGTHITKGAKYCFPFFLFKGKSRVLHRKTFDMWNHRKNKQQKEENKTFLGEVEKWCCLF